MDKLIGQVREVLENDVYGLGFHISDNQNSRGYWFMPYYYILQKVEDMKFPGIKKIHVTISGEIYLLPDCIAKMVK